MIGAVVRSEEDAVIRYTRLASPLGELLLTDHGAGLSGLYFDGHRRGPRVEEPTWRADDAPFAEVATQLSDYFAGSVTAFDVPLDLRGTPFQREVWAALLAVPYGTTTTYGRLAEALDRPGGARAVAAAVARNPVSVIVGCHRVVGNDGRLTGFAGGLDRKRWLLDLERRRRPGAPLGRSEGLARR